MSRGQRRRDQRGAAAVEAALITPVLLLMVFGMVEMAFLMKDNVAVTSASRVGARIASAAPGAGPAICDGEVACAPGTAPKFAQLAADAMQTNGSAIPTNQIDAIWIYEANDNGLPANMTSLPPRGANGQPPACPTNCVSFIWSPKKQAFRYGNGSWTEVANNVCKTSGKRVGVWFMTTHPWITGFDFIPGLGRSIQVDDYAVMSFEPLGIEDKC